ncbi:MAG: hypothetical protein JSS60_07985 [Verrucomicrobia bacterium]|nr:hypothetical protein [Verrucomicrobiota bacterium]
MRKFFYAAVLLIVSWTPSTNALELKRVILSTNNDPKYIQFWPVVAPLWKAMGLQPTLALIADENCPIDTSLGDVIRFDPIPNIPESLHSQVIRLFLPALFPDEGCLISDIDMLPVSKSYFIDGAASCPDDAFLVYRDRAHGWDYPRYPMCYNAAKGRVFASVFGISNPQQINAKISEWAEWGYGWNTDELLLYYFLKQWEGTGGHVMRLGHEVGPRIDRDFWPENTSTFDIGNFIDCHCKRPYSENKEIIDQIVKAILEQLQKKQSSMSH